MQRLYTRIGEPVTLGVLGAAHIGLLSSLAGLVPATLIACAAGAGALTVAVAVGWREAGGIRTMGARGIALSALGGALSCVIAPWLVALNRYTDAPPGTELIFFAWVLWGAIAIVAAGAARLRRPSAAAAALAVAVTAVTGAAAVLASWERPSSFSPFVRYFTEEIWMLAAGACFVGGGVLLARLSRTHGPARPMLVGGIAAAVVAVAVAVASAAAGSVDLASGLTRYGGSLVVWAAVWGLTWRLWTAMLATDRAGEAGVALAAAPVVLTGLLAVEAITGVAGPNPVIWGGVAGGALLAAAAALAVSGLEGSGAAGERATPIWAMVAAAVPGVVALVGLALPAMNASVWADRKGAIFEASWTLSGWESIAVWIVVASALLAFAAVARRSSTLALGALAAAAAYPLLLSMPYRSLTRWLPTDVMADLGTEYAWIHFDALPGWPAWAALAGAVACAALVLTGRLIARYARSAAARPEMEDAQ